MAVTDTLRPRTAVVTGGSRGIGLEVVRGLAASGVRVLVVSRDAQLGANALGSIRTQNPIADVTHWPTDLSLMTEVRRVAAEITAREPVLDLLVLNAAIVTAGRAVTAEGFECQFAVNHLSQYLLTHELLGTLVRAPGARIVVTASQVEQGARMDFADLMGAASYDSSAAYGQSKLANILFTFELADRLRETAVTVNCLHPGVVRTNLLNTLQSVKRRAGPPLSAWTETVAAGRRLIGRVLREVGLRPVVPDWAMTPQQGAELVLHVATSPALGDVTGQYYKDGHPALSSHQSRDLALRRQLWEVSARLVGVSPDWPHRSDAGDEDPPQVRG